MPIISDKVKSFFQSYTPDEITFFEKLPKSGGDRIYFRIGTRNKSYIVTYNENLQENETFLHFTDHFHRIKAPVPHILLRHPDGKMYIQEDLGKRPCWTN